MLFRILCWGATLSFNLTLYSSAGNNKSDKNIQGLTLTLGSKSTRETESHRVTFNDITSSVLLIILLMTVGSAAAPWIKVCRRHNWLFRCLGVRKYFLWERRPNIINKPTRFCRSDTPHAYRGDQAERAVEVFIYIHVLVSVVASGVWSSWLSRFHTIWLLLFGYWRHSVVAWKRCWMTSIKKVVSNTHD